MPVYSYRCDNCGVRFERHQHFSDPPLTRCPECKKNALRKIFTPVGIVFKGSGFYATDHRSPSGTGRNAPAEKSNDGKQEADTPSSSEKKTKEKSD